ncbi:Wzz/FepE/Etk N-terminal domain-containing protein [Uliginosibacterium sediminicola]|uniref:Wzz/FepE/Etk N-terminal domain-containing protein n=1 Tax=Uliginosibacterium sediminicola TaxID=2024550 RepID=A0ABU9YWW6_9RHOO
MEKAPPLAPLVQSSAETMSLHIFVCQLLKGKWKLLFSTLLGAALAFGLSVVVTPKWEVEAVIRVATVLGEPVESVQEFVDRLRSPYMVKSVLQARGLPPTSQNVKKLMEQTRLSVVGAGVQIRVRADSDTDATRLAQTYLDLAVQQHEQQVQTMIEAIKKHALLEQLATRYSDVHYFSDKKSSLPDVVDLLRSSETRFTVPPSSFPKPVFPNRILFLAAGILAGLALGLIWVFHGKAPTESGR